MCLEKQKDLKVRHKVIFSFLEEDGIRRTFNKKVRFYNNVKGSSKKLYYRIEKGIY